LTADKDDEGSAVIEKASLDDIEEILFVINTSNREAYRDIIPREHFKEPVVSAEELLQDFGRMRFYVYRVEGRIVGVAALQVEKGKLGRLRWVYVLPEYQRRGIGTSLVRHLEREARKLGLEKLWLTVVGGARWAVNFYRKLGYEPTGRTERHWSFDLIMEKKLKNREKL